MCVVYPGFLIKSLLWRSITNLLENNRPPADKLLGIWNWKKKLKPMSKSWNLPKILTRVQKFQFFQWIQDFCSVYVSDLYFTCFRIFCILQDFCTSVSIFCMNKCISNPVVQIWARLVYDRSVQTSGLLRSICDTDNIPLSWTLW